MDLSDDEEEAVSQLGKLAEFTKLTLRFSSISVPTTVLTRFLGKKRRNVRFYVSTTLGARISGRILQLETVTQSEAMRRRYRYLSHFPLTTTFQLCEIDLTEMLPSESLAPFMDELKKRANQRRQLAKKEQKEKIKAEAASTHSILIPTSSQLMSRDNSPPFSMDDFEALGNSAASSSPPVVGGRSLFSSVTRLGFAAGHDSPSLNIQETNGNHNMTTDSSGLTGLRNVETSSFANVISRAESLNSLNAPKTNDLGKKGKKATRVLLSTAGGRRY